MSTLNHTRSYPTFKQDMKSLDSLANAYNNAQASDMRETWKRKWYEMVTIISKRVQEWEVTVDKLEKKKQRKKWGEDKD